MGFGRDRRQERREDRGPAAKVAIGAAAVNHRRDKKGSDSESSDDEDGPKTFAMREKLLTFGNDFTINKMSRRRGKGKPVYYCDNKIVRVRNTFNLKNGKHGNTLYKIQEKKARIRDSMEIEDEEGNKIAEIKKRSVGVVRDNFVVKIRGEDNWQIHGSVLEHDFTIKEHGKDIVKVHKNWVAPIKDCYFIDIHGTDDTALALMVVIGIESLTDDE
mmetsp:Transcript_19603/g.21912  ORF Transcript_19603/g.21912 Transcript_19603/m.21912 type:complete len:216 (+) Transcript_19603:64-711(+)